MFAIFSAWGSVFSKLGVEGAENFRLILIRKIGDVSENSQIVAKVEEHRKSSVYFDKNVVQSKYYYTQNNRTLPSFDSLTQCGINNLDDIEKRRYLCDFCTKTFTRKDNLRRHGMKQHKVRII